MGRFWLWRIGGLHVELLRHFCHELLRREAVQILHDPMVTENLELVVGEDDSQEEIVRLVAGVVRISGASFLCHARCSRAPMMAVGDVESVNMGEKLL